MYKAGSKRKVLKKTLNTRECVISGKEDVAGCVSEEEDGSSKSSDNEAPGAPTGTRESPWVFMKLGTLPIP